MKVLVSGAGGFLGRYVVDELSRRGHAVRAIIRPKSTHPGWNTTVEIFRADLTFHDDLRAAFSEIDAVLHLAVAASGDESTKVVDSIIGTERFLQAMVKTKVTRFLHVSSLVVYDWTKAQSILNEETQLLNDFSEMSSYTIAKVRQEHTVTKFATDYSLRLTIARPGFIWGPQRTKIAGMGRHWPPFYLMFGPLNRLPLTHVSNCANCLVTMLERPAAIGKVFNIIDTDDIRVWRYVWEFARRNKQPGFPVPIPYYFALGAVRFTQFLRQRLLRTHPDQTSLLVPYRFESQFKPLCFSNQRLQDVLNWHAPLQFRECLAQSYTERIKAK
jgi:UDP-glucose 4-epimerase